MKYLIAIIFSCLVIVHSVKSETVAIPRSYTQITADGNFVFVMLAPNKETDGSSLPPEQRSKVVKIREKYSVSGLYSVDNTTTPIWTIDWYAQRVLVSSNGRYLVRIGPWASHLSDEAFTIFIGNRPVKGYIVSDLVDLKLLLPHSISHFEWEKEISINETEQTLQVQTLTYDSFSIDLRSGEIIKSYRPLRYLLSAIILFAIILIIVFFRYRGPSKSTKSINLNTI